MPSGRLRGSGHLLILDDIRVDRIDDESTRDALNLALQMDPRILPRAVNIDASDFVRQLVMAIGGARTHLAGFRIVNITTQADAVVVEFNSNLNVP